MIGWIKRLRHGVLVTTAMSVCVATPPTSGFAQQPPEALAEQPLATRAQLEALARQLSEGDKRDAELLARVQARLQQGDFRQGDLILLQVQGEQALKDTLTVGPDREVMLPTATVGSLSLNGVLMSELEETMTRYVGQFIKDPVVRARPLLRLSIQGQVGRPGFHPVPADAPLADALMAAGGTTASADLDDTRVERDGKAILEGEELTRAIASGRSLSDLNLHGGDQIFVERRDERGLLHKLRFVGLVVGLAGGVYGLTQIF
jgi:protein involved in polysaccharide export with SLBB domain